ncbi:hypothetical protein B0181_06065 [Moraxella caviae]|uniref:Phosphoribosyltransferase n=1 Tax=Moraxella caviae TaxID=34060 RepID=A0A1T0A368_9GAMM|nr:amidophosphoribosyltransferase [Moraxella caviae]OOR89771.1 hypothetical protein B0181_06065 [Moraxella caviae]STZ10712.1 Uncharacterised protein [Moraxella caviae]VEW11848.1 Uncharacterised protein [Moraxella caviae]
MLNRFIITQNEYLKSYTVAYHRCDYTSYNQPNNPDYINHLKNTFRTADLACLQNACKQLKYNLDNELIYILNQIRTRSPIAVCCVPRSKALSYYHSSQLLFSQCIRDTIANLQSHGYQILDGCNYIVRHTNTKTTHLSKSRYFESNHQNDGDMPYIGITKNTCHFSSDIRHKHILLIDDIYTKSVNVDEDCIQALLDMGATGVTFFAIGKTVDKLQNGSNNARMKAYNQFKHNTFK